MATDRQPSSPLWGVLLGSGIALLSAAAGASAVYVAFRGFPALPKREPAPPTTRFPAPPPVSGPPAPSVTELPPRPPFEYAGVRQAGPPRTNLIDQFADMERELAEMGRVGVQAGPPSWLDPDV